MKTRLSLLVILVVCAGVAWGQTVTTIDTATTPVIVTQDTAYVLPDTVQICPSAAQVIPAPCTAVLAQTVTGQPTLLVLGSQETAVFTALPVEDLNWRDVPAGYQSIFDEGNPLTHFQPNFAVTRRGNPFAPYFQVNQRISVAGTMERYAATYGTLTAQDRDALRQVGERYRTLTVNQARALGYQQVTVPINQGFVFMNPALLDNVLEPLRPEAFVFDRQGRAVGVQYHLLTPQPVLAFGQPTNASALVAGGQQLNVWLFRTNPYGLFAERHPDLVR